MDGFTLQPNMNLVGYDGGYIELFLEDELSGVFDSDEIRIYPNGNIKFGTHSGRINTNGKRILCKLLGKEYDGYNGYDDADIEFLRSTFNHNLIFREFLTVIQTVLKSAVKFIESKVPDSKVQFKSLWIHDIQFCTDNVLPVDPDRHFHELQQSVRHYFGAVKRIHENDANIEYPEYHYYWEILLNRGRKAKRGKKELQYLKHYMKRSSVRTEAEFKSPSLKSKTMAGRFEGLAELGDKFHRCLLELFSSSDYMPTTIDRGQFFDRLREYGIKSPETNRKYEELYKQIDAYSCYTPSFLTKNLRLSPPQIKRLSDPDNGVFKATKLHSLDGRPTRGNNFLLRQDWQSVDPSKLEKNLRRGQWMTEKALIDFAKEALKWGASELRADFKKAFDKTLSASVSYSTWNSDENDELIQLLKSKSA